MGTPRPSKGALVRHVMKSHYGTKPLMDETTLKAWSVDELLTLHRNQIKIGGLIEDCPLFSFELTAATRDKMDGEQ